MSNTRKATPSWTIPDWMRPYLDCIVNTGGGDVEEMVNGDADPYINLPLSTLQACVKSQVSFLAKLRKHGLLPNPERDKLARELAEDIISSHKAYYQPSQSMPMRESDWVNEIDKARQLLKLYEES